MVLVSISNIGFATETAAVSFDDMLTGVDCTVETLLMGALLALHADVVNAMPLFKEEFKFDPADTELVSTNICDLLFCFNACTELSSSNDVLDATFESNLSTFEYLHTFEYVYELIGLLDVCAVELVSDDVADFNNDCDDVKLHVSKGTEKLRPTFTTVAFATDDDKDSVVIAVAVSSLNFELSCSAISPSSFTSVALFVMLRTGFHLFEANIPDWLLE